MNILKLSSLFTSAVLLLAPFAVANDKNCFNPRTGANFICSEPVLKPQIDDLDGSAFYAYLTGSYTLSVRQTVEMCDTTTVQISENTVRTITQCYH